MAIVLAIRLRLMHMRYDYYESNHKNKGGQSSKEELNDAIKGKQFITNY